MSGSILSVHEAKQKGAPGADYTVGSGIKGHPIILLSLQKDGGQASEK